MSTQQNEFHDPVLKDAVRRCWAGDCPSEQLRKRISSLFADQPLVENPVRRAAARPIYFRPWVVGPMAAAAVVAISFVIFWKVMSGPRELPQALATDLVLTHDHCCAMPTHQELKDDHDVLLAKTDDAGTRAVLRERLGQPVLAYHPHQAGWDFHGASVCKVGTTPSGHLVYSRGGDALSVFMLPGKLMPGAKDGTEYVATVGQHSIVGFIKDGALFCLVGSGPAGTVSIDELKKMQSEMEPTIALATPMRVHGNNVVLAELLRPVH